MYGALEGEVKSATFCIHNVLHMYGWVKNINRAELQHE